MSMIYRYLPLFLFLFKINLGNAQVPSPLQYFGFNIGDDYQLANFTQTEAYFKKVAAASDRVKMVSIGKTEEGRDQHMLIVTSPQNHRQLELYRDLSVRMARAEGISEEEARRLSKKGKAVVWIDGGLHATETVGMQQLIESVWLFTSRTDPETMRILDQVIILFTHANPDGQELVSDWFMRFPDQKKRKLARLPLLYQKYAGHDNNRDFFMQNLKETQNIGRQLFVDWIPQIMYNHHQRGPAGSVLAGPPYRDPFNYVFDPMMITGIDAVGAAMINRLNAENKSGYTRLNGSVFSTWYNGGLRTTTHFHNMIGILTELVGGPVPEEIPFIPDRLIPNNNTPFPVTPRKWYFRQSIDYSISLNYAVLDYAARNSDHLLYNIYKMGRNSIERGSADYWTPYPARFDEIRSAYAEDQSGRNRPVATSGTIPVRYYDSLFTNQKLRDPRGFIIPADQSDFPTAIKFVNALIRTGIRVEKATSAFQVNNIHYPAGSYVVKTNQAFRPHVLDMFEPQNHPNDFRYPGGPPIAPYDAAGWTLAFQMGVKFDRVLNDFNGPFETVPYGQIQKGSEKTGAGRGGFVLSPEVNDTYALVNSLLKSGIDVYRVGEGSFAPAGSFYVGYGKGTKIALDSLTARYGVKVKTLEKKPSGPMQVMKRQLRIGLWDVYGGSMPSGWMRLIFEQFGFEFKQVFSKEIDAGNLRDKFDLIIFPGRAIPARSAASTNDSESDTTGIPVIYHAMLGSITSGKSIPQIRSFLENGGKVITLGTSTQLAYHLNLPVESAITEIADGGTRRALPQEKYYIPGSILRVHTDTTALANRGLPYHLDVYFDKSPVFRLSADGVSSGKVIPLAWYGAAPLRSGWAWGGEYIKGGVAAFQAPVGKGMLYAYGPEVAFRAQSHATYKWLFNLMY